MTDELRPAILILKKRGEADRYFFFEDHNTAFDYVDVMKETGWKWFLTMPTVYRAGEIPDALARAAMYDHDLFGEG